MKLSTRTRYATRAILELAEHFGQGPLQTRVIAKHQEISIKYLEQIMSALKSAGIIRSQRGAKGGYVLSQPPEKIKLSEIFDIFEGPTMTVECAVNEKYCDKSDDCVARQVWCEIQKAIKGILESITLQDALEKAKNSKPADYQI
jgi:Rrf2 family cysteine metabolism transcriptional repressor